MLKRISIFAGIILITLICLTAHASAQTPFDTGSWSENALSNIVLYLINVIIGAIANGFMWVAIVFVKASIAINSTLASGSSFAEFGWALTLSFANLLIVIGIIAIAFGTMFRQAWGAKLLPNLVIIALLINFSYFIAAELIKIADKITVVFLNAADASTQWTTFANFSAANSAPIGGELGNWLGFAGSSLANLISPLFSIAFTFIAFLTLLAIAIAFLYRYISLTILLILLPVALGMSLLPIKMAKTNAWQEWQGGFTKQLLFGPAMAFFIYLAFALLNNYPPTATEGFVAAFGADIGKFIAVIGILLGGLTVANKMGVYGAGMLQTGLDWGTKKAKETGLRLSTERLRSEKGKAATEWMQKTPGLRFVGRQLNTLAAKGEKLLSDDSKFKESPERLAQMVPSLPSTERAVVLSKLAKSDDLWRVKDLKQYINPKHKATTESIGKDFKDIEVGTGVNVAAMEAFQLAEKTTDPKEKKDLYETAEKELKIFYGKFSKNNFTKFPINGIYGDYNKEHPYLGLDETSLYEMRSLITKSLLADPGNLNKIAPNIKSENFDNLFESVVTQAGVQIGGPIRIETKLPGGGVVTTDKKIVEENKKTAKDGLKKKRPDVYKAFQRTLNARETGIGFAPITPETPITPPTV